MNEKELRIKYIRVLEKFAKKTINLLKVSHFNFEVFKIRTIKNYEEIKKSQEVSLTSTYLISLKNFINTVLQSIQNSSSGFEYDINAMLKQANLLEKEKNKNSYKKDKHKNKKFDDNY